MFVTSIRQITESELPGLLIVLSGRVAGGFPGPAADHYEPPISLDELVDLRAPHVFLAEAEGDSMAPAAILTRTKLIVDRARTPHPGHIVVPYVDNQPVVKRLDKKVDGTLFLSSDNPNYPPS
ncbi:S24 family peptidase, partial [Pseudomonas mosselii]|uniref:S24 family peptidase n=1 Tax=Pseudomonas mosselii TaxID=78327 RepID=UPI0021DAA146